MMRIKRCRRCGHPDYEHSGRCCMYNRCDQRCTPALADYPDDVENIPTFGWDGKVLEVFH